MQFHRELVVWAEHSTTLIPASPFHMRTQTPLARSMSVTRPKSSVTPASVLHGDKQMDSPWRRESGRPNLEETGHGEDGEGQVSRKKSVLVTVCARHAT